MKRDQLSEIICGIDDRHIAEAYRFDPARCGDSPERIVPMKKKRILAFALAAALLLSFSKAERFLRRTVGMGSVDGISHEHIVRVDGFGMETEKEILDGLHEYDSVRLHALAS